MKKITFLLVLILSSFAFAHNPVITAYVDSTCPRADGRTLELYVEGNDGFQIINPDDMVIERFGEEGEFLIDDSSIAAFGDFEISLSSGIGITTSVDSLQTVGNASTTAYIRLVSGLTKAPYSGSLEVSSANATSETITLSGNVLGELTSDMVITGVFDGPLTGGTPKVIELYVIRDITDLSVFGVGNANNGGGSDGQEFTFPNVTASVETISTSLQSNLILMSFSDSIQITPPVLPTSMATML